MVSHSPRLHHWPPQLTTPQFSPLLIVFPCHVASYHSPNWPWIPPNCSSKYSGTTVSQKTVFQTRESSSYCKPSVLWLNINVSLSSDYHPQANSQVDQLNQEIWRFLPLPLMGRVCPDLLNPLLYRRGWPIDVAIHIPSYNWSEGTAIHQDLRLNIPFRKSSVQWYFQNNPTSQHSFISTQITTLTSKSLHFSCITTQTQNQVPGAEPPSFFIGDRWSTHL